jgi:predicted RNase H-like HicB family nuclease
MATTSFTVVIEPEDEGGFSVYVPDLPGCASQGESQAEALANIQEAIELHIEGLKADGMTVPAPRAQIATVQVRAA